MNPHRLTSVDCSFVEHNLIAYHERTLLIPQIKAARSHIETCDTCARSLSEYRMLEGMLRGDSVRFQPVMGVETAARIQRNVYRRVRWRMMFRQPRLIQVINALGMVSILLFCFIGYQNIQLSDQVEEVSRENAILTENNRRLEVVNRQYVPLDSEYNELQQKQTELAYQNTQLSNQNNHYVHVGSQYNVLQQKQTVLAHENTQLRDDLLLLQDDLLAQGKYSQLAKLHEQVAQTPPVLESKEVGTTARSKMVAADSLVLPAGEELDIDWLLLMMVANSNLEMVGDLLVKGANIEAKDREGLTPLMYALNRRNQPMVDLLIEHGADINVKTPTQGTPLYRAYRTAEFNGDTRFFEQLLDAGADLHRPTIGETTMWSILVVNGEAELVEKVLARGTDVDQVALYDRTPLMLAAAAGQFDVASALLYAGADRDVETMAGKTAVTLACDAGHESVARLILSWQSGRTVACEHEGTQVISTFPKSHF